VAGRTVAVPSERSTAYLLFRLWAAGRSPAHIEVVPFAEIMPAVRDGRFEAGLVIHESRFTYPSYGLAALVDLGAWWEEDTGLPIPLGAILAERSLDADAIASVVRASVEHAWAHPADSAAYVAEHAAEMSPDVQRQHIALYVNEFTRELGEEGYAAAEALLGRAYAAGLTPTDPQLRL
jgi:1,4-dihydroxy-6-naphthoate synthase